MFVLPLEVSISISLMPKLRYCMKHRKVFEYQDGKYCKRKAQVELECNITLALAWLIKNVHTKIIINGLWYDKSQIFGIIVTKHLKNSWN